MIKLLEHNKDTYKRLCEVLSTNNKCALVQATGTGKSYIAGKYIEEHANTALILVPTNAIADAWSELMNEEERQIDIITYQAFSKEPNNYLDYDLVIADEMHHLGSDVWGKKFVETYLESENHKIIGLTATEVRYLDNSRDMAEEIFENIRVDGCDLPTAINTGILPTFKYVSALYCDESDFDKWKEKAGKISDIEVQNELKGKLDVCIKNMASVKQAVNENLTEDYKKIIVFLNNVESKETALEMFKDVFPTANFYDVDYSKCRTENNSQIKKFKSDSNRAVLFAVDMLNEGVHIKGTDCVIMFRKTQSPQIYLQQLGRGLESKSEKMPIIFDFVSNTKNISAKYQTDSENGSSTIERWNRDIEKDKQIVVKSYVSEMENVIYDISKIIGTIPWTKEEDDFLINYYKILHPKKCANELGRTVKAVHYRAKVLGVKIYWTKEEDDFIVENLKKMSCDELGKCLNRSAQAVRARCNSLGIRLSKSVMKEWTKEEDEFLMIHAKDMNFKKIGEILGCNEWVVKNRSKKLMIKKRPRITKEDAKYIRDNYAKIKTLEISERLGITQDMVRAIANKMGIKTSYKKYEESEDNFIKETYGMMTISEIASRLGRTKASVAGRMSKLKIDKNSNYYSKSEEDFISNNYSKMSCKDIAKHLNRTEKGIQWKVKSLGLSKAK